MKLYNLFSRVLGPDSLNIECNIKYVCLILFSKEGIGTLLILSKVIFIRIIGWILEPEIKNCSPQKNPTLFVHRSYSSIKFFYIEDCN